MILPSEFTARTRRLLDDEYELLEQALQTDPPVSIRLNPSKRFEAVDGERVPWCEQGYYLHERPSFTFDPLFHAGTYYVQEAASMFVGEAVRQLLSFPALTLDLCAAPGGKSTHLLSVLPAGSLLVGNEVIRSRSRILAENITKWGIPDCVVTNNDPKDFSALRELFDLIVADMPCSGEGMFRKDPAGHEEWSVANVRHCAARQRRIIHDVWDALKPGGLLIYSTCTFNTEENEENIAYIAETFGAEAVSFDVPSEWSISGALSGTLPVYRFFPHRTKGEGFCLAVLRKPGAAEHVARRKLRQKHLPQPVPAQAKEWLTEPEAYHFERIGDVVRGILSVHRETVQLLGEQLHVLSAGVTIGEVKGKDLLPSPALALSTAMRRDAFARVDVSREEAIRYLQNEALTLPGDVPRGFTLVTYRDVPLGFVKNLGTRANNLYPNEWRIRKKNG